MSIAVESEMGRPLGATTEHIPSGSVREEQQRWRPLSARTRFNGLLAPVSSNPIHSLAALLDAAIAQSDVTVNRAFKDDGLRLCALLVILRFQIFVGNILRSELCPARRCSF